MSMTSSWWVLAVLAVLWLPAWVVRVPQCCWSKLVAKHNDRIEHNVHEKLSDVGNPSTLGIVKVCCEVCCCLLFAVSQKTLQCMI